MASVYHTPIMACHWHCGIQGCTESSQIVNVVAASSEQHHIKQAATTVCGVRLPVIAEQINRHR